MVPPCAYLLACAYAASLRHFSGGVNPFLPNMHGLSSLRAALFVRSYLWTIIREVS